MLTLVVICACLNAICIGAFGALVDQMIRSRRELNKANEDAKLLTESFAKEHNAMAQKVVELGDKVNQITITLGYKR